MDTSRGRAGEAVNRPRKTPTPRQTIPTRINVRHSCNNETSVIAHPLSFAMALKSVERDPPLFHIHGYFKLTEFLLRRIYGDCSHVLLVSLKWTLSGGSWDCFRNWKPDRSGLLISRCK